jgi:hypothetical protein
MYHCRLNVPGRPDLPHQETLLAQSTLHPLPRSQDLPEILRHRCTCHPRKVVSRDTGRVGSRLIQRAATGTGDMENATLPSTLVTPGWRMVMAFRWDTVCRMPVMQTIPRAPHRCHSNRLMKLRLITVQILQARMERLVVDHRSGRHTKVHTRGHSRGRPRLPRCIPSRPQF